VVIERVIRNAFFGPLALHDINRIVENPFNKKITGLSHERASAREMPQGHRQGTTVILMTVGNSHRLDINIRDLRVKRETLSALNPRRGSCIQQDMMAAGFHQPGTGANGIGGIEVGDAHGHRLEGRNAGREPFASKRSSSLDSLWI